MDGDKCRSISLDTRETSAAAGVMSRSLNKYFTRRIEDSQAERVKNSVHGDTMVVETSNPVIEEILGSWRGRIGPQYEAYRGHVYRMYNYCLRLRQCSDEEMAKLAVAACFHDIGIWSNGTLDYIPPSVAQTKMYLADSGFEKWNEEICMMVELHHKRSPYQDERYPLVEVFRKGDLVDFSWGLFRFGIGREYVLQVKARIPNAGFHRFLFRAWFSWVLRHPSNPLPFVRW